MSASIDGGGPRVRVEGSRMHRAATAALAHRGLVLQDGTPHEVTASIRTVMTLMTVQEHDGRLHPMALRMDDRPSAMGVYLSTTGRGSARRTTLVVTRRLPATVVSAVRGRMLGDLVKIPGVPADLVVERIDEVDAVGSVIVLMDDDVVLPARRAA